MTATFTRWDVADHLLTEEDARLYLQAAFEDDLGDGRLVVAALGDVVRARKVSKLARAAELSREGLHKALSATGNPSFATLLKIIRALGMRLRVVSQRVENPRN